MSQMVDFDNVLNTFVGDIPTPISNELNEVAQEFISANQYEGKPVVNLPQTEILNVAFDSTGGSFTPTRDFVITSLQVDLTLRTSSHTLEISAGIDVNVLTGAFLLTNALQPFATKSYFVPVPNWKFGKGSRIFANVNASIGASEEVYIIFNGYYL